MKPSNGALKSDERYEVFTYLKENKNIIKIARGYCEAIVAPQIGQLTIKNTNKSFISLKNNNYNRKMAFTKNGWGLGWGVMLIGKETLVNSYTKTNQSKDSNLIIRVNSLTIYEDWYKTKINICEDFFKDELKVIKLWPYQSHQSVTCLCTNRGDMVFIVEGCK